MEGINISVSRTPFLQPPSLPAPLIFSNAVLSHGQLLLSYLPLPPPVPFLPPCGLLLTAGLTAKIFVFFWTMYFVHKPKGIDYTYIEGAFTLGYTQNVKSAEK